MVLGAIVIRRICEVVFLRFLEISLQSCREGLTLFCDKLPHRKQRRINPQSIKCSHTYCCNHFFWSFRIVSDFDSVISDLLTKNTNVFRYYTGK
jgi:hypothetical protein